MPFNAIFSIVLTADSLQHFPFLRRVFAKTHKQRIVDAFMHVDRCLILLLFIGSH